MTITVDIRPEVEAETDPAVRRSWARDRSSCRHPARRRRSSATGQSLVDACAKVRGLLTDEEIGSACR